MMGKGLRKYLLDESIFSEVDTEEKAYWLGFIYADGHVSNYSVRIELTFLDFNHLEKMKNFMQSTHPIKLSRKDCVKVDFSSKKITTDLRKLGLESNKTFNIVTPDIQKSLLRHFYRGFFDGDGWVTSRKTKNKKLEYCSTGHIGWEIGFSSASEIFINQIKSWISLQINCDCGYLCLRNPNTFQLTFGGNNIFLKITDLLYDKSNIYLNRKFERIEYAREKIQT